MNFSPEMIAMAQKQMESMSPEQLAEARKHSAARRACMQKESHRR